MMTKVEGGLGQGTEAFWTGSEAPGEAIDMASILCAQSRYDEAERFLRAAVASMEGACGPESYEVAVACDQLAQLLVTTGQIEAATAVYRDVVRIKGNTLQPLHPEVLEARHNLALLRDAAGHSAEAQTLGSEGRPVLAELPNTCGGRRS